MNTASLALGSGVVGQVSAYTHSHVTSAAWISLRRHSVSASSAACPPTALRRRRRQHSSRQEHSLQCRRKHATVPCSITRLAARKLDVSPSER